MAELNYHHLRYFQAIAHEGNLTRAARILNVSQSSLSAQIKLLEERLGQLLFERRGRQLFLTEAGRIALDHADRIFATGQDLVATLKQGTGSRRSIRIGAISTLSRNFQLAFLRPVLAMEDVEIVLRSGSADELNTALTALQLDLVLTNQAPMVDALSGVIAREIDEQPVSLIGVPALCNPDRTIGQLIAAHPVILPTASSGIRMAFDALADREGVLPRIAAEIDDMAMMRLIAREGTGLAVIPPIVVRDELQAGILAEAHRLPGITERFYAVTVQRRFPNPLVRSLMAAAGGYIE